ncbi:MAG TPA: nucleotidyltransferase domain-containing protein [Solirubrobacterales bacterium]|nr:nucleotidyltransferase domain-containing protein [Solirubrobacterales bacterium]
MSAERIANLAQRVREFHGVELEQVLEVIDYLRDGEDSVLVGGSLAYGLGNHKSDLDIVIAAPPGGESSSRMPLEHFIDSLRVDVWKLRRDELQEIFDRARESLQSEAAFAGAFGDVFEQADLKLLHRVAYGVVIDGAPVAPSGEDYRAVAQDILIREYAERMRHSLYVAQLALANGAMVAATINARFGVEEALQARIAARGFPFSDNKWLRVRLDGEAPDLREVYTPLAILPEGAEECRRFVEEAVAAAQELTGTPLEQGRLALDAAWENAGLSLFGAGDLRLLVSPEQDVVFELGTEESEAWRALGEGTIWSCATCTPVQMSLCYSLYAQGMLKLAWSRGLPLAELDVPKEQAVDEVC